MPVLLSRPDRSFHVCVHSFVSDRKQNLRLTVVRHPLGRFPFSILWEAKLKGKKLYSLLPIDTAAVVGK